MCERCHPPKLYYSGTPRCGIQLLHALPLFVSPFFHAQDYVKWRGLLLYRFLATLVDADQSVKDLGFFTLTRPLINKVSTVPYHVQFWRCASNTKK